MSIEHTQRDNIHQMNQFYVILFRYFSKGVIDVLANFSIISINMHIKGNVYYMPIYSTIRIILITRLQFREKKK